MANQLKTIIQLVVELVMMTILKKRRLKKNLKRKSPQLVVRKMSPKRMKNLMLTLMKTKNQPS